MMTVQNKDLYTNLTSKYITNRNLKVVAPLNFFNLFYFEKFFGLNIHSVSKGLTGQKETHFYSRSPLQLFTKCCTRSFYLKKMGLSPTPLLHFHLPDFGNNSFQFSRDRNARTAESVRMT